MAVIGIDLGTTNSLCAVCRDGKIELVPNPNGDYLTPSVVSFGDQGEVYVGKIAKEMQITRPKQTFAEFKRDMGTDRIFRACGQEYRAEELSAFVLKKLKEDAEKFLGEPVTEAVISVPAYFDDDRRYATKNAGKLAGLYVERIVNEPSAVALRHQVREKEMETFIIFDFGGGTLDVSLVEAFDNMVEIRAVAGDNHLGGKDFNEVIAEDFLKNCGIDPSSLGEKEHGIVLREAELLKKQLSKEDTAERTVLLGEKEYVMRLDNQKLIRIAAGLFQRMSVPLKRVMDDAGMQWEDIDRIILAGGSSKMPVVRRYVESISETEVVMDDRPDECVAIGVGLTVAIKERSVEWKDMILADICPFSLGTEIYDGTFSTIIERNDTLPCSRSRYYVTTADNQTTMHFKIYQGEHLNAKENLLLGELDITDLPEAPAGETGVLVTFLYDINGILDIHIKSATNEVRKVILNKNIRMSGEELDKCIEKMNQTALYPAGRERNRLLVERAKRLFEESSGVVRENIRVLLKQFAEAVDYGAERDIREQYVRLSLYLEAVEQNRVSLKEDPSFWEEHEDE